MELNNYYTSIILYGPFGYYLYMMSVRCCFSTVQCNDMFYEEIGYAWSLEKSMVSYVALFDNMTFNAFMID
jgi:hypothetical protein